MKEFINTIIRLGIIVSLSDRKLFIEKVSEQLEEFNLDRDKSEKVSKIIASYLDDLKDNINMRNSMRNIFNENNIADKEDIAEMNKLLKNIIKELQQLKDKNFNR
jgi:hypothetical protein